MNNDTIMSYKLEKWNNDIARGLIPNNVILSMYIIIGLLGNSSVILIYGFKMKGNKEERYFIPFLATADLSASLVCASFGIALNMMQAQFNDTHLCKAWWFFAGYTTVCSILILLVIAVHRYLKVCRPSGRHMTQKWKRIALFLVLMVAFALSLPTTYFYGSVPFPNKDKEIVGMRCSRLKTTNKTGSLIFGGIGVLVAVSIIISLISLYSRIGYTIITHFKYTKKTAKPDSNTDTVGKLSKADNSHVVCSSSNDQPRETETEMYSLETDNTEFSGIVYSTTSKEHSKREIPTANKTMEGKATVFKSSAKRRKERRNKKVVYKFTLMFMLITVVFLICYIPKVIVMLLEARNPNFWEEFSYSARAGVLFVYRMYIINNIINPIIYAFLDDRFSQEIKKIFKKFRVF